MHQRQRPTDTTELIRPKDLSSSAYLDDPFALVAVLRENYPCYRDWPGNAYWITRYDDVTSVFVDDANFETRPRRTAAPWLCGRDLRGHPDVESAIAEITDAVAPSIAETIVEHIARAGRSDLTSDLAARFAIDITNAVLGVEEADARWVAERLLRLPRLSHWDPRLALDAARAVHDLRAYFSARMDTGSSNDGLLARLTGLTLDGAAVSADDVLVTLLESDHETLHGSLANLWFLLLTQPEQLEHVRAESFVMKFAYLEALRHSPPVLSVRRYARHEVERFGRLLPEGALVLCSAAAANRDPRVFSDPDVFSVSRKDLCQREPRGQYRADGLASGIAFGHGPPSRRPAVPEGQPRSRYAQTRDIAVLISRLLLERAPRIRLAAGAAPRLRSLTLGEMHTCWSLPVTC